MPGYVFNPHPAVAVPVEGTDKSFPVSRILCVGRNYEAHKREMGNLDRDPPFFFCKPPQAIVTNDRDVPYPSMTQDFHFEVELVIAIGRGGVSIETTHATDHIFGFAVGVDLTRRDLQSRAKTAGQPWEASKAFDASAPISMIRQWSGSPPNGSIRLSVNGEIKQDAAISDMIWNVPEIVSEASKIWALLPGDLIFTGTPEGVGPLARGDSVTAEIASVGRLGFTVV